MTELTDLSDIDAENVLVTGEPISGQTFMSRTDNVWYAVLGLLSRFRNSSVFRLRDATDKTKLLALDLSGLTTATTRTLTVPNRSGTLALTNSVDTRRNRIVNGDKLVSQENGQTAGTTNGRYISDQNAMYFVTSAGTFTGVNVLTLSPAGGYRDRITITTADASLAAGENLTYTQNIEGSSVRDLKWGTAGAVSIVVRRGFKFPAGTWPIAFHNSAANRSYVTTFTVSALEANTDIVREFAIPGDQSGTWLTADGVIGLTMDVVIGAGSTFQGVAGWQAGNVLTVAGATNGMALSGAIFEFFDEGLKADPDATGVYGQYEVGESHPVYRSERYLPVFDFPVTDSSFLSQAFSSTNGRFLVPLTVKTAKSVSGVVFTGTVSALNAPAGAALAISSLTLSTSSPSTASVAYICSAGLSPGNAAFIIFNAGSKLIFTGSRLS